MSSVQKRRIVGPASTVTVQMDSRGFVVESTERLTQQQAIGSTGSGNGQLDTGYGVMVVPDGSEVWLADYGNDRIGMFATADGSWVGSFGSTGTGNGEFQGPRDLHHDGTYVYVADYTNDRVQKFDIATQTYQDSWSTGAGSAPTGVWYNATNGRVYVACSGSQQIKAYDTNGTLVDTISLNYAPIGVAVSPDGQYLYVTSSDACRVYDLQANTEYKGNVDTRNIASTGAKYVHVDAIGHVYVADSGSLRVYKYAPGWPLVGVFLSEGTADLQVTTEFGGIARYEKNLFVVDQGADRIIHAVPSSRGNGTVFKIGNDGNVQFVGNVFHSDAI